jgi:hypothetical protein
MVRERCGLASLQHSQLLVKFVELTAESFTVRMRGQKLVPQLVSNR